MIDIKKELYNILKGFDISPEFKYITIDYTNGVRLYTHLPQYDIKEFEYHVNLRYVCVFKGFTTKFYNYTDINEFDKNHIAQSDMVQFREYIKDKEYNLLIDNDGLHLYYVARERMHMFEVVKVKNSRGRGIFDKWLLKKEVNDNLNICRLGFIKGQTLNDYACYTIEEILNNDIPIADWSKITNNKMENKDG